MQHSRLQIYLFQWNICTNLQRLLRSQCNPQTGPTAQRWFWLLQEENTWKVFCHIQKETWEIYVKRQKRGRRGKYKTPKPFYLQGNTMVHLIWTLFPFSRWIWRWRYKLFSWQEISFFLRKWLVRELRILLCFFSFSYCECWKWWSTRYFVYVYRLLHPPQAFTCISQYIQSLNRR